MCFSECDACRADERIDPGVRILCQPAHAVHQLAHKSTHACVRAHV